jgi:PAS domain S-box-containing protein
MARSIHLRCLTCGLPLAVGLRAFDFGSSRNVLELGLFLLFCGIILGLTLALRRANQKAKAAAIMAQRYGELLQKQIAVPQRIERALPAAKNDAEPRPAAEAALRALGESEARYRTVGELIPFGVWALDGDGEVAYVSPIFLDMLGHTLEEHKKQWVSRIHPDDYERIVSGLPRWLESRKPWDQLFRIRGKDGQYRTLLSRGTPLYDEDGQVLSWVGINLDLTQHKHAEEEVIRLNLELQRRADELQTVLDILPIGVAIAHDPQCHRITHNPYFSELLNVPAWANASLTAPGNERPTTFTNYRNGLEVPTSELPMQLASTGVEVREMELDLVCRGRDPRTMLYCARPLFDEQGNVRGSVGAGLDITDRKRHEKELEDSQRTLSTLVERLREADQKKDEFLSILAHELRNLLAPLRNGLQMIKLATNDGDAVELARPMMERQVGQMVRLIDDLLDLSRVSQGKLTLRKTRIPLAAVVQNAVETSRPLVEEAGHDFTLDMPDEPLYVDADEIRLSQVFANLLNNAAKYTERGGHIRLDVERQGSDVVVTLNDNGLGIPHHMLSKVFEMFTQVDRSTERSQGGLGIGLNLAKRLVEMHNGSIEARSDGHGMGSTFIVRLPVVLSLAGESSSELAERFPGPTARRRILIVDDNSDAALSLAMVLNLMGNETRTAQDGLEAVSTAAAFQPHLVLLDIGMPKLNGYDACRRIREQPWGKNAIIVACTGWGHHEDERKSKESGFNFHMVKPVEPAALEKLLASVPAATA